MAFTAATTRGMHASAGFPGRAFTLALPMLARFAQAGRAGVWFQLRDDGPGGAREHIPRLTERFYRVDKGRGRGTGNTGLGLAIVKHIVARHRGLLSIESEPGAGACFRVWLPSS